MASMNYRRVDARPLTGEKDQEFTLAYEQLKSPLGYVSYTDMAHALATTPEQVMQFVKYLHLDGSRWNVKFSNDQNDESVFFKLEERSQARQQLFRYRSQVA